MISFLRICIAFNIQSYHHTISTIDVIHMDHYCGLVFYIIQHINVDSRGLCMEQHNPHFTTTALVTQAYSLG